MADISSSRLVIVFVAILNLGWPSGGSRTAGDECADLGHEARPRRGGAPALCRCPGRRFECGGWMWHKGCART
jgi:hypothetical protein